MDEKLTGWNCSVLNKDGNENKKKLSRKHQKTVQDSLSVYWTAEVGNQLGAGTSVLITFSGFRKLGRERCVPEILFHRLYLFSTIMRSLPPSESVVKSIPLLLSSIICIVIHQFGALGVFTAVDAYNRFVQFFGTAFYSTCLLIQVKKSHENKLKKNF